MLPSDCSASGAYAPGPEEKKTTTTVRTMYRAMLGLLSANLAQTRGQVHQCIPWQLLSCNFSCNMCVVTVIMPVAVAGQSKS
jgi:hypothetical protein